MKERAKLYVKAANSLRTPLNHFPLTCLAQSKGRVFHRCGRNLYGVNFSKFLNDLSRG